jgi:hypothetical protein
MQTGEPTGRWAILVRHPGFVSRLVAEADKAARFRSLPGCEHWLGEPPIRYWPTREEAEAHAQQLRDIYDAGSFDVIPEVWRAVLDYPG